MSRLRALLRRRGVHVLAVVLLLALALSGFAFSVTHFADTLTVTVKVLSNTGNTSPETTIFARTFHDESLVREIQGEITGIPALNPFRKTNYTLGGTNPTYVYTFHFTWLGLPIQDASTTSQDSYPWTISTFGIGSDFIPRVADASFLARLAKRTGMPLRLQSELKVAHLLRGQTSCTLL